MYIAAALAFLVLTLVAVALWTRPVRRSVRWMDTPLHDRSTTTTTYSSDPEVQPPRTAQSRQERGQATNVAVSD